MLSPHALKGPWAAGRRFLGSTGLPSGAIYASSLLYAGIPIGVDATGTGTAAVPYLTVDKINTAGAAAGTGALNGNPASPTVYKHASILSCTKAYTFQPVFPYGATIQSTTTTSRVVAIAPTTGQTITFGKLTIDGQSVVPDGFRLVDETTKYTLNLPGTRIANFITHGITTIGSGSKVDLTLTGGNITSADAGTGVLLVEMLAGAISVRDTNVSIAAQNASGGGGVVIAAIATASGVTVDIERVNVTTTLKSSLTGSGDSLGISVENIPGVVIKDCRAVCDGHPGSRQVNNFSVDVSADANAQSAANFVWSNLYAFNGTNGGKLFCVGLEAQQNAATGLINGGTVSNCTGVGDANSEASIHGAFNGSGANTAWSNINVSHVAFAIADKEGNGASYTDFTVDYCTANPIRLKGSQNAAVVRGTFTFRAGYGDSQRMVYATDNTTTGQVTTACTISNGSFANRGATGVIFVEVETGSDVVFSGNDYQLVSGTLDAFPWRYQGTQYSTLAAWKAAHEPNATGNMS